MPPPRGVMCQVCGKKCLKSSVAIHERACRAKFAKSHSECRVCTAMVGNHEWQDHKSFCKGAGPLTKEEKAQNARVKALVSKANKRDELPGYSDAAAAYDPDAPIPTCTTGGPSSGPSATAPMDMAAMMEKLRRLEQENARLKGDPQSTAAAPAVPAHAPAPTETPAPANGYESCVPADSIYAAGDPRIACKVCSRKFNPDRYTAHMKVCTKLAAKRMRKVWRGDKARLEGTEFSTVRRMGTPERVKEYRRKSKWRQQSKHAGDYMDERLRIVLSGVESKVDVSAEKVNARSSASLKKFLRERRTQLNELKEVKERNPGEFTTRESTPSNSGRRQRKQTRRQQPKPKAPSASPDAALRSSNQRQPRKSPSVVSAARSGASSGRLSAAAAGRRPNATAARRAPPRPEPAKPKFGRRANAAGRRAAAKRSIPTGLSVTGGPGAQVKVKPEAAPRSGPGAAQRRRDAAARRAASGDSRSGTSSAGGSSRRARAAPQRGQSDKQRRLIETRKAFAAAGRKNVKGVRHTKRNAMRDCIVPGQKPKPGGSSRAQPARAPARRKRAPAPAAKQAAQPFSMDVDLKGFTGKTGGVAPKGLGSKSVHRNNEARKENTAPGKRGDGRSRVSGGVIKQSRGDELMATGKLGGNVGTMDDYRQREAARRKNRVALAAVTQGPAKAAARPAKKMSRKQMRQATNFASRAAGQETIARPRDGAALADRRAAYYEKLMGGM